MAGSHDHEDLRQDIRSLFDNDKAILARLEAIEDIIETLRAALEDTDG